ncbi:hypothetical protein ACQCN2_11690 [Brevibacillus ginsengisoli]|uniref:hypothetical protein n=1 Tax=Brevibacillus ginsengisoli TaxID=363854 RepID=UPI003CE78248
MKKSLILFTCFLVLCATWFSSPVLQKAEAAKKVLQSEKVAQSITEWVLDDERGYIYAISKESNQLLFISLNNLQVEKEIDIGSYPTNLVLQNTKLYIALSGSTSIAVVDVNNKVIENKLITSNKPSQLAIEGNKLFYVSGDKGWQELYMFNLDSSSDEKIDINSAQFFSFTDPDIVADPVKHVLYIGESGTSGGNCIALSTKNYGILHRSTYKEGYGFSYPERKILFDGTSVYYAGRKLDGSNLATIDGTYKTRADNGNSRAETIIYVKGKYVISNTTVYDRDLFIPIMELPVNKNDLNSRDTRIKVLMDKSDNLIIYNSKEQLLKRLPLKKTLPKTDFKIQKNKITFGDKITDWAYDNKRQMIYAIQRDTNKLLFVDSGDFTVKKELFIGSEPTDIEYYKEKLYVALYGSTKVAVIELNKNNKVDVIELMQSPYRIAVYDDKMYSIGGDQWGYLYRYSFKKKTSERAMNVRFYPPFFAVDRTNNLLYLADHELHVIDTIKDIQLEEIGGTYGEKVVIDGNDLFFGKRRFDKNRLSYSKGTYNEPIIYAYNDYIFSSKNLYDKESYKEIFEFPFEVTDVIVDDNGGILLYNNNDKTIYKYKSVTELKKSFTESKLEASLSDLKIKAGESTNIKIFAIYEDGRKEDVTKLAKWSVHDRGICWISEGEVYAEKSGNTVATATYKGLSIDIPVKVVDTTQLKISTGDLKLKQGETQKLKVISVYSDQTEEDVTELANWWSSNSGVAEVYRGKVRAIANGEAILTAKYRGQSIEVRVSVVSTEKKLKNLVPSSKKLTMKINQNKQVKVKAVYEDGSSEYVTEKVEWSIENQEIADVTNGLVVTKAVGQSIISGTYLGKSVKIPLTVKKD